MRPRASKDLARELVGDALAQAIDGLEGIDQDVALALGHGIGVNVVAYGTPGLEVGDLLAQQEARDMAE